MPMDHLVSILLLLHLIEKCVSGTLLGSRTILRQTLSYIDCFCLGVAFAATIDL